MMIFFFKHRLLSGMRSLETNLSNLKPNVVCTGPVQHFIELVHFFTSVAERASVQHTNGESGERFIIIYENLYRVTHGPPCAPKQLQVVERARV